MVRDRTKLGEKAAGIGVFGNIALSSFKLVVGVLANSTAVIADAIHSLSDVLISALVWFGIRESKTPPDASHPFGHGDIEPIVGLITSVVLAIIGFEFARYSFSKLFIDNPIPSALAIYATVIAIASKEAMTRYVINIADRIKSTALKADAMHHRSDVYSSIVVLAGVIGARVGYPILDPLVGLGISLIIIKIGVDVGKDNIRQLMGTVPSPRLKREIKKVAMTMPGVKLVHKIRIHTLGAYATVDLHVCVDPTLPLGKSHKIAHQVQEKIVETFPEISFALVHVEPYDTHHKRNH